jgi:hypothetical protein
MGRLYVSRLYMSRFYMSRFYMGRHYGRPMPRSFTQRYGEFMPPASQAPSIDEHGTDRISLKVCAHFLDTANVWSRW